MSKSLVIFCALLVIAALAITSDGKTFPCRDPYGDCNQCTNHKGDIVAVTRNVCGTYNVQKCRTIFGGNSGLCDDGCNTCMCGAGGVASTYAFCSIYTKRDCVVAHGEGKWACMDSQCTCTNDGLGFYF